MPQRVAPEDALERVQSAAGHLLSAARLNFGHVDVTASPEKLVELVRTLRDHDDLRFHFFSFLSGVDRSEFGGGDDSDESGEGGGQSGLEVLIHLYSPENVMHVTIHVPLPLERAKCPTISEVFAGALWHERETWEMFDIQFEAHPHLVHLYLPEDFEGFPLRKSFKLPSRIVKPWPGAKDPEEAAAGGR